MRSASRTPSSIHYPQNSFQVPKLRSFGKKSKKELIYRQFRSDAPLKMTKEHRSDSVCSKMKLNIR